MAEEAGGVVAEAGAGEAALLAVRAAVQAVESMVQWAPAASDVRLEALPIP